MIIAMYPLRQTAKTQREQIAHEAADWQARLTTGRADPVAFAQWRAQSSAHAIAMARVIGAWEVLDTVRTATEGHVPARRHFLRTAGVIVTSGLAIGFLAERAAAWPRAETAIGERKLVVLSNGSRAMLNTDSALSWHASGADMRIKLDRGEIALQLVGQHPVSLTAGSHSSSLSPGRFDVRLHNDTLEVAVLHGSASTGESVSTRADRRQALLVGPQGGSAVDAAERIERAVAWQSGEILFQNEPLGDAVADYNRYLQRKIVIVDQSLASIRVGGRFTTTDPTPFLRGLRQGLGIRVDADNSGFSLRRG